MKTSLREITQTKTGFFMVKVDQFFLSLCDMTESYNKFDS